MGSPVIYTIGHSTHEIDYFLELLQEYGVNCVVDIRSVPASAYNPQYNQEFFRNYLKDNKIRYLHFAEEYGARQSDPDLLDQDGKIDFEKVRQSHLFKRGIDRLKQGVNIGFVIALLCSESEPLDCHRFSMVSVGLEEAGFQVKHILKDKSIKSNHELKQELLKKLEKKIPQKDLFNPDLTKDYQLKAAYRLKNREICCPVQ